MTDAQYDYMKLIEAENFRLKKQLKKEQNEKKRHKHLNRVLSKKLREAEDRNNKKGGKYRGK